MPEGGRIPPGHAPLKTSTPPITESLIADATAQIMAILEALQSDLAALKTEADD